MRKEEQPSYFHREIMLQYRYRSPAAGKNSRRLLIAFKEYTAYEN